MEFNDKSAIYLQIADYMCDNILMETWKANEKILSIRELAVNLEVNPNTAMRAYEFLQTRGIIYNKRGIGYFVSEDAVLKVRNYMKEEFINQSLPVFFKSIFQLDINFGELEAMYNDYKLTLINASNEN
ncbi:GntR family transcriptional regulator [Alistipes sp. ZOR0009]|jgi:DNA-binding transcriptional regulator YhcF (GntR family)|uniref:GntR family transcriptional regulator n=1 Tax=Alistipes sp. ZOR0009 TaxID=1339253 RepID=UPI0006474824|nr:GntR family transcriptional regulator [Alistipes sp. ZOR0009]